MSDLELLLEPLRARVTQEFDSLGTFAMHLVAAAEGVRLARRAALNEAAKIIKQDARAQIGNYQEAVGNYPAWEPLAESTLEEKARLGVTPIGRMDADAPLYRFGDLLKSFRSELVSDDEVIVGSTDPVMDYHEFGTAKMPPRPALGPALLKNVEKIQHLFAGFTMEALIAGQRLGYRFSRTGGIGEAET